MFELTPWLLADVISDNPGSRGVFISYAKIF